MWCMSSGLGNGKKAIYNDKLQGFLGTGRTLMCFLGQHMPIWFWQATSSLVGRFFTHTVKNLPAMRETRVWSLGQEEPLEEGMATHSGILAWRIPRTEEPGKLKSMVSQRVRHDWATNTHTHKLLLSDPKPLNFLKLVLKEMFPSLHAFHQADNIKTAVLFLGFED